MVFDASAVMAMLNCEAGGDDASARIDGSAVMSVVNVGEIIGKMVSRGADPQVARAAVSRLIQRWIAPDGEQAGRVGELGAIKDLSLADRFCIALAEARGETLVTADRDWRAVPIRVPVEYIR